MTSSSHIRRLALIGGIAGTILVGATSSAGALPIDLRPEPGGDTRTLQLTLRYGPDTLQNVDLGTPGPSVGDRLVFAADAFRNDQPVGLGAGECVIVRYRLPATHFEHCVGTLSLPQGQITVQWIVDRIRNVRPTKVALTGGTGAYRTVRGEMLVWAPNADGIEPLTLRLILD